MYRDRAPVAPPPAPPRPNARMFPLALEVEGVDVLATRSRRVYVIRGLLGVFVLPILFVVLFLLIGVGLFEQAPFSDDTLNALQLILTIAGILWGLLLLLLARRLSLRGATRFDRSRGVVVAGGAEHPFNELEVHVRRLPGISGWMSIELWRAQRRVVTIHDRLPSFHRQDVAAHGEYIARLLGDAPVQAAPGAALGPQKYLIPDNTAAMLCYLPIQGVHLIASLYYLFAARDRPFVLFAAKQSLTQLAVTLVATFVFAVSFGAPLALLTGREPVAIVFIVLLSLSLLTVVIGNLVAHIVACVRAQSGRTWVIPWLRPIVKKWLPDDVNT